jgi:hypothetical protein
MLVIDHDMSNDDSHTTLAVCFQVYYTISCSRL